MTRSTKFAATGAALALAIGSVALGTPAGAGSVSVTRVCPTPARGSASCLALLVRGGAHLSASDGPSGYHPADLLDAYRLDPTRGADQTIGIVDAFDDPHAEADLAVYRATFGLAPCTTANGCFTKVNQNGTASPLPHRRINWDLEISVDVDMASAICPNCRILLVEASTPKFVDLAVAVDRAAAMGASEISNSYGGREDRAIAADYDHPGIPITVSSGDTGYATGPLSPADFSTVTAVGGTSLQPATNTRGWTETAWSGAGSGCSGIVAKPAWQHDTGCSMRTIVDVSADADPATGVSVYDTIGYDGFIVVGGTSVSSPIIAGAYALAGNAASINDASLSYANANDLHDVKAGSNGTCTVAYLCTGLKGYDGPTGLGSPKGTAAF